MTTQNLVTSLLRIKQAFMLSTIPLGEYIAIHLFFCHLGCLGFIFPLQTVKYTLTHVHWQTLPCGLLVPVCFPPGTYPETQGTNDLTIQDTIELSSRRIKQLTPHHPEQALAAKSTSHLSTVNYLSASTHTCAGHPRFLSSEMSAHFCQLFLSGCLFHIYGSSLQILDTKLSLFQVRQISSQLMACFYFLLESFDRHAQFSQSTCVSLFLCEYSLQYLMLRNPPVLSQKGTWFSSFTSFNITSISRPDAAMGTQSTLTSAITKTRKQTISYIKR